jgi:thiol-disulfide isomerase/thioredoxin
MTVQVIAVLLRLGLALVFLVAGVAKLADRAGSRRALRGFGLPAGWAAPLGVALPAAEIVVAVGLLVPGTAPWAALGALALLLVFVVGIGYNLARGRSPECHCFGRLHSAPAGRGTLVRNLVLAAVSALVIWREWWRPDRAGPLARPGTVSVAEVVVVAVVVVVLAALVVQGWLLLELVRQNGRLLLRIDALEAAAGGHREHVARRAAGLPVGARAPGFELPDLAGVPTSLDALLAARRPVVLVFSNPGCGPCAALRPVLQRWHRDHGDAVTLAVVSGGGRERAGEAAVADLPYVLLQGDGEVAEAYQVQGTPSAVVVRPDGTVGSELAAGGDAITVLLARTVDAARPGSVETISGGVVGGVGGGSPLRTPTPGSPAPSFTRPDLDGYPVALTDVLGSPTLLLFWDPGCGFCAGMFEELKAREERPPAGAPRLLLVSGGTAEANRAMGLRSPIVLDPGFGIGRAFGARGTPSAVLLDAEGVVVSDVAAGAPAVRALLDGHQPLNLLPA